MDKNISLRPAGIEDTDILLAWRNDPETRKSSKNTCPLTRAVHEKWLKQSLSDPSRRLYIAEKEGMPVGTVRVDFDPSDNSHLFSWTVSPEFRGMGVGKVMVALAAKKVKGTLKAEIRKDNIPSIRIAENAGMRFQYERNGFLCYVRKSGDEKNMHRLFPGGKIFIVAELSANHNHDIDIAVRTIRAMKEAGADAVKLQTYTPDTLTIDCGNEYFRIRQGTLWDGETFYRLYSRAYTPWEWHPKLKKTAEDAGLEFFSTPFDKTAVDFLETLDVPYYKIASFEITDIPLIEYVASKGKPVIISTGIAELDDIEKAVQACRNAGNDRIVLLKCTSAYPAPAEEINLRTMPDMAERFKTTVGVSDHTTGIAVPVAAAALGASVIEKHFILDKKLGGPDVQFSIEPADFRAMVQAVRETEKALGGISYELTEKTKKSREFSRSLFAVEDIKKGERFTESNVRSIRPGYGLPPALLGSIIGKSATMDIKRGTPLRTDMIQ